MDAHKKDRFTEDEWMLEKDDFENIVITTKGRKAANAPEICTFENAGFYEGKLTELEKEQLANINLIKNSKNMFDALRNAIKKVQELGGCADTENQALLAAIGNPHTINAKIQ